VQEHDEKPVVLPASEPYGDGEDTRADETSGHGDGDITDKVLQMSVWLNRVLQQHR
jgi:hypothetical protein